MYLKRSALLGLLGAISIAGACTASQNQDAKDTPSQSTQAISEKAPDNNEMVEITIRMPDGRVIVRKEPKAASRIDPSHPILQGQRPAIVVSATNSGTVNTLESGVTGGSNSAIPTTGSASGGGSSSTANSGGRGGGSSGSGHAGGTVGSGGSEDNTIPPVPPDNDYTVRLFAWENSGPTFQHVLRTYIADPRGKTPRQLAQRIAREIRDERPEKIAIRFWKELDPAIRYTFDPSDPRALINSGGYTLGLKEYWDSFAAELANLGIRPDYLIHDLEKGIGYWDIPTSDRQRFFGELMNPHRPLSSVLPTSMRNITVDQFMDYRDPQGTVALNDYNQFAAEFRANMINDVFSGAFTDAFGGYIKISNYNDLNPSFQTFHYTNRPDKAATCGGISAPIAYLDHRNENTPRYARTEKIQRWNRLIDVLNRARSAAGTGLVTPWVSAPGYGKYGANSWARPTELAGEYKIWEIMMDHMLAMGIDTFVLWNPGPRFNPNAHVTDAFVDQWLADHPRAAGPQLRNLPEIPLDADSITTNGVTTTYQQFLEALNQ